MMSQTHLAHMWASLWAGPGVTRGRVYTSLRGWHKACATKSAKAGLGVAGSTGRSVQGAILGSAPVPLAAHAPRQPLGLCLQQTPGPVCAVHTSSSTGYMLCEAACPAWSLPAGLVDRAHMERTPHAGPPWCMQHVWAVLSHIPCAEPTDPRAPCEHSPWGQHGAVHGLDPALHMAQGVRVSGCMLRLRPTPLTCLVENAMSSPYMIFTAWGQSWSNNSWAGSSLHIIVLTHLL